MDVEAAKRRAAESAVEAVEDGHVVGLGSGSTAAHAIRALGRQVDAGLDVEGVPTSFQSREVAREVGIPVLALEDVERIDVAIDGADQVAVGDGASSDYPLVKGGGAAHAREKVVDAAARRFIVVVDERKLSNALDRPIPIEVLPGARSVVATTLRERGGDPVLREASEKSGPVVTDNGNLVLDCDFGTVGDPAALAADLAAVPGVVAHGLFVSVTDEVHVGTETGVDVLPRADSR